MELKEIEQLFLDLLSEPYTVAVDVGAHLGCYTETMIKNKNIVYAYEPVPELYEKLKNEFGSQNSVTIKNLALSDRNGTTSLRIPIVNDKIKYGWASCYRNFEKEYPVKTILVDTVTLDSEDIQNVGLIKIDVEGFELEVIKGATQTIINSKPNLIVELEERHRRGTVEMTSKHLSDMGYKGFYIDILEHDVKPFDSSRIKTMQSDFLNGQYQNYVNNFIFVSIDRYEDIINNFASKRKMIKMWTRSRSEV